MSVDSVQTKKLIREYTALAPSYDQRWSSYLRASFEMTLEQMTDLPADRVLDADAALREIRRVISAGGNLIITDWCRNYVAMKLLNRLLPWTQHAHVHTFNTGELKNSLANAGFGIIGETRRKIDWFWGLMTIHATALT